MLIDRLEHLQRSSPLCGNGINLAYNGRSATLDDIVSHLIGVVHFLLRLLLHPCCEAREALLIEIEGHREIEIGRPDFSCDLRVDCVL